MFIQDVIVCSHEFSGGLRLNVSKFDLVDVPLYAGVIQ